MRPTVQLSLLTLVALLGTPAVTADRSADNEKLANIGNVVAGSLLTVGGLAGIKQAADDAHKATLQAGEMERVKKRQKEDDEEYETLQDLKRARKAAGLPVSPGSSGSSSPIPRYADSPVGYSYPSNNYSGLRNPANREATFAAADAEVLREKLKRKRRQRAQDDELEKAEDAERSAKKLKMISLATAGAGLAGTFFGARRAYNGIGGLVKGDEDSDDDDDNDKKGKDKDKGKEDDSDVVVPGKSSGGKAVSAAAPAQAPADLTAATPATAQAVAPAQPPAVVQAPASAQSLTTVQAAAPAPVPVTSQGAVAAQPTVSVQAPAPALTSAATPTVTSDLPKTNPATGKKLEVKVTVNQR
ncbi:hypothetical protein IWQ60_008683 [Tieghemiomyces parasiticus]|uniref:Uncharacterized protein n=1 Tax=Tieghemiomyces parasiticus TaxID=78921 RepID=A0A9W7ZR00_9FUNG|nr:hypothetical protein IWQ60_008683 [Tieghemiomyces parasiticus]